MPRILTVLALIGLVAGTRVRAHPDDEEKGGELRARISVTWTGQFTGRTKETEVQDNITVTWTADVRQPVPRGAKVWEVNTATADWKWTVRGGGQAKAGKYAQSWFYQSKSQRRGPGSSMWPMHLREASYEIVIPELGEAEIVPVAGGESVAPGGAGEAIEETVAGVFLAQAMGSARNTLVMAEARAGLDEQFRAQLKGTFDPRRNEVGGSGSPSVTVDQRMEGVGQRSATLQVSYAWSVGAQREEFEAEMWVDRGDEDWLPGGSVMGEGYEGNVLLAHARVFPKDHPERTSSRKARFRFALKEVSTEPGVCMNWPPQGEQGVKDTPDLAFEKRANPDLDVEAEWDAAEGKAGSRAATKTWGTEAAAIVSSFDYGGYGKLTVLADLEGGGTVEAHLRGKKDVRNMGIPRDENGNHVADAWEGTTARASAADADEDRTPAPTHKGDGLTLYAEYRGFIVGTGLERHIRTDPSRQTLFIHSDDAELTKGIELFGAGSRLEVVEISEEQYVSNEVRVVNANSKTGRAGFGGLGMQHGLHLTLRQLDAYTGGQSRIGPPRFVDEVQVAVGSAHADVIAHELGHAVGMPHHGKGWFLCDMDSGCRSKMSLPEAREYTTDTGKKLSDVSVAHDEFSGGEECLMRYPEADYIERIEGGKVRYYRYRYPDGVRPKAQVRFCRADRGTGVNDPLHKPWPKAGDATPGCGNSLRFVRVSDRYDSQEEELRARGCLP